MEKLIKPADGVGQVTVNNGRVITADKSGHVEVTASEARFMRQEGWTTPGVSFSSSSAKGYPCGRCGFVAFFKGECPKCGGVCCVPNKLSSNVTDC
jgi:hypothetical protein